MVDPCVDIAGVQFDLTFDATLLEAVSVEEGSLLNGTGCATFFSPGSIDNVGGTITNVYGAIITAGCCVPGPGSFAAVTFRVIVPPEDCQDTTTILELANVIVGDCDAEAVPISVSNGSVDIICAPNWDVNMDGCANVLDMIIIGQSFNCCVGTPCYNERADVNRDGCVNVLDLITVGQVFNECWR